MRELPILFTRENRQAVMEGRKTQTRRLLNPQPEASLSQIVGTNEWTYTLCDRGWKPRYSERDCCYLKEPYCHGIEWDDCKPSEVDPLCGGNDIWYLDDGERPTEGWGKYRHARFMPRWVARHWIEITRIIGPHRIQTISKIDAIAEGCGKDNPINEFRLLWEFIHGPGSWEDNLYVWGYEFIRKF